MKHPDDLDGDLDDDALPPHLRRLLDKGGDGPPLSRAAQERVLGRVLATVGVATVGAAAVTAATTTTATTTAAATGATTGGVAATTTTTTTAATAAATAATTATATTAVATTAAATTAVAAGGLAVSVKAAVLAAGLGVAGLTGVGVVAVVDRGPSLPAREAPIPAPSSSTTTPPSGLAPAVVATPAPALEPPSPETPPTPPTPPTSSSVAPSVSPSNASSTTKKPPAAASPSLEMAWEVPQLESARAALAAGQPAEALGLVEDHARRAPGSALREEGRAIAVLALVALGRHDEAQSAATAFAAAHPQSLFLPRVRRAVASATSSTTPSPSSPSSTR
jgi:hypothetical protein